MNEPSKAPQAGPELVVLAISRGDADRVALDASFPPPGWRVARLDEASSRSDEGPGLLEGLARAAPASVDAVWSWQTLQGLFAHEVPGALSEFLRVLRPGGRALVAVPDLRAVAERVAAGDLEEATCEASSALDLIFGDGRAIAQGRRASENRCGFTAKTLAAALAAAGFVNVEVRRSGFGLRARAEKPGVPASPPLERGRPAVAPDREALAKARECHRAGDFRGAEAILRTLLARVPEDAQLHYLLGACLHASGDVEGALASFRRAVALDPGHAEAHNHLGTVLARRGEIDEAIAGFEAALRLRPGMPDAQANLALALGRRGKAVGAGLPAASEESQEAIRRGIEHETAGRSDRAEASYREALRIDPECIAAHCNLAGLLGRRGALDEAEGHCRKAIALNPEVAVAHLNLGFVLANRDRTTEAVASYREALRLQPDQYKGHSNLGSALGRLGELDEAEAACREAIRIRPDYAEAHLNLGFVLLEQGRLAEAEASHREALRHRPGWATTHSALLCCLNYRPEHDAASLLDEHRLWALEHARVPRLGPAPDLDRDPDRRLRVGYVSPDFRVHPVAFFLAPILAYHDRARVEAYGYSEVSAPDGTTDQIRSYSAAWRPTLGLSDVEVAEQVRRDRIDILVDLAGHTSGNRLGVFARKPAPIQVTYVGYPGTTGLDRIDYLLTDALVDPPDVPPWSTETPWRLPGCFCCYAPPSNAPDVGPPPSNRNGYVTFGSLHKLPKLHPGVLDLWAAVLEAVPSSRLRIFRKTLKGTRRAAILAHLESRGIAAERVELLGELEGGGLHLKAYRAIDVSLDVFPWSGHTTTCESLWMGVPVVTLLGSRHAGRMSASVLNALGLSGWIAGTAEQYVAEARRLAEDVDGLARLRAGLRERVLRSPLCDGKAWTRNLEAAYREMWRAWCASDAGD